MYVTCIPVEASEDATERWCCLPLNYQKTLIGIEETTIEWISDCDDSLNISIQFFTWFNIINNNLDQQETHIVMLNNTSNSITIPTSNLTNSMGEQVYFRIIAKNTTIDAISSKNKMIFFNGECQFIIAYYITFYTVACNIVYT